MNARKAPPHSSRKDTVADLAARIESDIRSRGLRPGDRYSSTAETARAFKAGTVPVNRAMQLLVKRHVLDRRQGLGTIVSMKFETARQAAQLKRVRVMMSDRRLNDEGVFESGLLMGLQEALPGTALGIEFPPLNDREEDRYLVEVIDEALRSRGTEGFVLIASSMQMQRAFHDSGLPTVVLGSLYASMEGMPFLERDQRGIGRMAAEYLLSRGHRSLVMVARQRPGILPGDHIAFDAMGQVAAQAGLSAGAMLIRCLPHEPRVVEAEIRQLLASSVEVPGFFLRPSDMVGPVFAAIRGQGLVPQRDVAVVVDGHHLPPSTRPLCPAIRLTVSEEEFGRRLGQLLLARARGESVAALGETVRSRLELPDDEG